MQRATAEEADRARIGDLRPVLDRVILVRLLLVSLTDGVDKLLQFMNLPEIQAAVTENGEVGKDLRKNLRQLRAYVEDLRPVRNQIGGHLDPAAIRKRLDKVQPDEIGVMWLAESEHLQTQYDSAHEIAVGAWTHVAGVTEAADTNADDLSRIDALFGQAQHAQVKFVASARIALHLFEATATAANAPSAQS